MHHRPILLTLALALAACGGGSTLPADERQSLGESVRDATVASSEDLATSFADDADTAPPALVEEAPRTEGVVASSTEPTTEPLGDDELLVRFDLRRGETLAHFARWSELPVEAIAAHSGLELNGVHPVGAEVVLPATPEQRAEIERRREAHRIRRVEGYLARRGGAEGVGFHAVRTGETAWSIARDAQGIPVWLLEAYNPSVDLETLKPGMELRVPLLTDTVVEVEVDGDGEGDTAAP